MTSRDRVAFVVVPPGYASAEEFAYDCGYELFVPPIEPPVPDAELAVIAELAEHSPSSTNMVTGWKLASIASELLSRRAPSAALADVWMREEDRSEQNKPAAYEFAVGGDRPPGGGWIPLQRINISGATGITSEQHEANTRLRSVSPDLLASVKELREAAAAMMRVIANHVELIPEMGAECQRVGVKDGFGKRAQEAIAKAESQSAATPDLLPLVQHMLGAIDGGHIDSEEVDGNERDGIPPHKWHEEWAASARAAIVAEPPRGDAPQPTHMREMLEQISRVKSFREFSGILPKVRTLLGESE